MRSVPCKEKSAIAPRLRHKRLQRRDGFLNRWPRLDLTGHILRETAQQGFLKAIIRPVLDFVAHRGLRIIPAKLRITLRRHRHAIRVIGVNEILERWLFHHYSKPAKGINPLVGTP